MPAGTGPSELGPADLHTQWEVDCKAVGDGQQALHYLGSYLYRGVISERDILRCQEGRVTYRWRDAKSGKPAIRTLPARACPTNGAGRGFARPSLIRSSLIR